MTASSQQLSDEVKAVRDLVYAQKGGHELALDLYWHPGAGKPEPLVVWIHGGAWMSGDKSWMPPVLYLLDNGFAMTSVDYRLSQEALFPAQIEDCKAARAAREVGGQGPALAPLHQVGRLHVEQLIGVLWIITPGVEGQDVGISHAGDVG